MASSLSSPEDSAVDAGVSTRERILVAAGPIFAQSGFEGTTVREICRRASVNVASINYHFGDKQQLYLETVKYARHVRASEYPLPEWDERTPAEQKLHEFVSMLLARLLAMQSAPWQVQLLMREVLQPTAACRELVDDYFRPLFEVLLEVIQELCPQPLSDVQQIQLGFSVVGQCLFYRYASDMSAMFVTDEQRLRGFNLSQLADHITRFCFTAIKNYPTSDQQAAQRVSIED